MAVLPCPFCGGKVVLKYITGSIGYTPDKVSIRCEVCRVGFAEDAEKWEPDIGTYSIRKKAEETILKRWNTRLGDGGKST